MAFNISVEKIWPPKEERSLIFFTKKKLAVTFYEVEVSLLQTEWDIRPEDQNFVRTRIEVDRSGNFAAASEDREAWSPRIRSWSSFGMRSLNHWCPRHTGDPETKQ
jgi:hypothetical protein